VCRPCKESTDKAPSRASRLDCGALKLRSNLYLMVAGALAPVVVLAVAAAALLVQHERDTMEQEAVGRTHSAMSAVDAEVRGHLTALQALAA
jgi:hypothetical protein